MELSKAVELLQGKDDTIQEMLTYLNTPDRIDDRFNASVTFIKHTSLTEDEALLYLAGMEAALFIVQKENA